MSSDAIGDGPAGQRAPEPAGEAGDLAGQTAARALAVAAALGDALGEIARRLDQYSAFGRRSRKIIIALAVSFTLDIVLTVVLGLTAFSAHDTAAANSQLVRDVHAAQVSLHSAQLSACANGNVFREDQNIIWRDFIGLITKPAAGESPAQVAKTSQLAAQFLGYVTKVNHKVNCTALYGK